MDPRLALNSLCSCGDLDFSDPPASPLSAGITSPYPVLCNRTHGFGLAGLPAELQSLAQESKVFVLT